MNFFLVVDLILYFFIISHSYSLICKGQIKAKELYFFGIYTLLINCALLVRILQKSFMVP